MLIGSLEHSIVVKLNLEQWFSGAFPKEYGGDSNQMHAPEFFCFQISTKKCKDPRNSVEKLLCVSGIVYIWMIFFSLPSFASAVKTRCTVCKAPAFQIVQSLKFAFVYVSKVLYFFTGTKQIHFHFYRVTKLTAVVRQLLPFFFFVLCWLHLLFIFISVCILIWIMQEVSEEEERCERGVPHSMCPWLFFAPALLRVEEVGVG